jgi:excisionase family DNA binding protein
MMYVFKLQMAGSDSWLSVKEAATYLGKSPHWLYQNRERLQIPCTAVGGTLRFEKSKLDDWISNHSQNQSNRLSRQEFVTKVSLI